MSLPNSTYYALIFRNRNPTRGLPKVNQITSIPRSNCALSKLVSKIQIRSRPERIVFAFRFTAVFFQKDRKFFFFPLFLSDEIYLLLSKFDGELEPVQMHPLAVLERRPGRIVVQQHLQLVRTSRVIQQGGGEVLALSSELLESRQFFSRTFSSAAETFINEINSKGGRRIANRSFHPLARISPSPYFQFHGHKLSSYVMLPRP